MPEGPEIRRSADQIAAVLAGRQLEAVWFRVPDLVRYSEVLSGCRVERIDTRGKALLIRFDIGLSLYSHNQLYGVWYIRKRGQMPKTRRSLRVGLYTREDSALLYSASDIMLLTPAQELTHPYLSRLGPDVLDPSVTWRDLSQRLYLQAYRNRSLGSLYLDQGFVAGIGNYLRTEILFAAGLHPRVRPRELPLRMRNRLARETLAIARRSYDTGGITNRESLVRKLKAAGQSRRQFRFALFSRAGKPCPICGTSIERSEAGSRRIYLCPSCQPLHCRS